MEREIATIGMDISASEASKLMMAKNVDYLIVFEKDVPAGIVTDRDLVRKIMVKDKEASKTVVSEIMSSPLITIDPDATVDEAVQIMIEKDIRRLPVRRDSILYGVFTGRGLGRHLKEYEEAVAGDLIKHMSLVSRILA
jgi:CBS domain-containing protein